MCRTNCLLITALFVVYTIYSGSGSFEFHSTTTDARGRTTGWKYSSAAGGSWEELDFEGGWEGWDRERLRGGASDRTAEWLTLLELQPPAEPLAIRKAYKRLALRFHPDRCADDGREELRGLSCEASFVGIRDAYEGLKLRGKTSRGVEGL